MSKGWGGRKVAELRALVYATYPPVCSRCHQPINVMLSRGDGRRLAPHPLSASIDHIIPRSRGGDDSIENLRPMHHSCNSSRGAGHEPRRQPRFNSDFFGPPAT